MAYLPLAHILEFSLELFLFMGGVKIGYGTPFTLNDNAPGLADGQKCDIKLFQPTCMSSVPLVLDRIVKQIYETLKARTPVSTDIFNYLMAYKKYWTAKGYETPITNWLLCEKVREKLGGKLMYMIVGGAPLNANTQALVKCALNIKLMQGKRPIFVLLISVIA